MPDVDPGGVDDLDVYYAETRGEPYRFRWSGQQWELPHVNDVDWRVGDLLDKETLTLPEVRKALELSFGEQWPAFTATPQPTSLMTSVFSRWLKASGVALGEEVGSGDSSSSTEPKSKLTSVDSTGSASAGPSTGPRKSATRRAKSSS